jgi:hypothetical protein
LESWGISRSQRGRGPPLDMDEVEIPVLTSLPSLILNLKG